MHRKLLLSIFIALCTRVGASNRLILNDNSDEYPLGKYLYLLEDPSNQITIEKILTLQSSFQASTLNTPNFGITTSTIWCFFDIENHSSKEWILNFSYPCTDSIILYFEKNGTIQKLENGWFYPLKSRAVITNDLNIALPAQGAGTTRYFMKIKGNVILLPMSVSQKKILDESFRTNYGYFIFYLGLVAMLFFYNLAIFFTSRQWEYLFYSCWVFCSIVFFGNLKGYGSLLLPEQVNKLLEHVNMVAAAAGIFILLFIEYTLRLREILPRMIRWYRLLMAINIIVIICSAFRLFYVAYNLVMFNLFVSVVIGLITGILVYRKGFKFAKFYMVAFGITFLSMWIFIFIFLNILEWNSYTSNSVLIGNSIEMVLFSFGLGQKIKTITEERQKAQELALKTLEEKEQLISGQNVMLAEMVEERTSELMLEKEKSDKLLMNILPDEVAEELKKTGTAEAKMYQNVTVIFTDFVNFTKISEEMSPVELVEEINKYFTAFDHIIEKYQLEKIKTIGDAYMAVCGLPEQFPDHAIRALQAAIEIRDWVADSGHKFEIRIGLNSGNVITGIVGVKKYAYDIWGDTVNTAARMEQNSVAGKINISGSTYLLVKDQFPLEYRGKISAKNKGEIDMYFVL